MCGILGTISPASDPAILHTGTLSHRGPDARGNTRVTLPWCTVSLGMTRLSIVDRRALTVPFRYHSGITLALNGEVYNWRELRAELSDGTPWETDCDAEVLARAWERWGVHCLSRLNGMWALALCDEARGLVFLARDRAGEKPLYYTWDDRGLHFASEAKALPIVLQETACPEVPVLEFDCLESTPFQGVHRLGPGEYILATHPCDLGNPVPVRWWELPVGATDEGMTWDTAVDELQSLLADAVRLRIPDGLAAAVLLSGGIDSAIVQAIARSPNCYTVTFPDDGVDCMTDAQACSFGTATRPVTFGLSDLHSALPDIAWHLDSPATWTAVAQWFIAQRISQDGIRVWLSGEGADELFAGYSRHRALWYIDQAHADPVLSAYGPVRRVAFGDDTDTLARLLDRSTTGTGHDHARWLVDWYGGIGTLVERMARTEFHTTMQVLLRMAARMAAAFAIENRSPFLDYRIMELSARRPVRHKVDGQYTKAVVREVARRLGVPLQVTDSTTKRGLFLPWSQWCSGTSGARGKWDRSSFASLLAATWRAVFFDSR